MLMKYHKPTKQNDEPYGTIWNANLEVGTELWIQIGEPDVEWVRLGDLYEKTYLKSPDSQNIMVAEMLIGLGHVGSMLDIGI